MKKFILCIAICMLAAFSAVAGTPGKEKSVPKSAPEKLLQTILSSYKGQVVLVDVWATWCGPCRYGHSVIEPLKSSRFKDVSFVYLTSDTSPRSDWNTMIPNIQGDHYYLSKSQLGTILRQVESEAFPTYIVVDRNGNILNTIIGFSEDELFEALDKALGR